MENVKKKFANFRAGVDTMEYFCVFIENMLNKVNEDNEEDVELINDFLDLIISRNTIPYYKLQSMDNDINHLYSKLNFDIKEIKEEDFLNISNRIINQLKQNK